MTLAIGEFIRRFLIHVLPHGFHRIRLCVPKTLSELMRRWNRLSWRNDQAVLFRSGRPGLAVQVEGTA
jgi:hypothetical protein